MGQWRHALHVLVCEVPGERALLAVQLTVPVIGRFPFLRFVAFPWDASPVTLLVYMP